MHNMDQIGAEFSRYRIGVLPIKGFALMSYASTVEPLRAANLLGGVPYYDVVNIGIDDRPIPSSGAAQVAPSAVVGDELVLDYLFVVAGGNPMEFSDARVFRWLTRMARSGVRLGGVSGGPVILARAGLMAGRRMTVHWEHAAALAEMHPDLVLERTLYVIDRDRVTCAGGTAPVDMMHALIAGHHGARFAHRVSDWFLHTEIRPPVGPQRGGMASRIGTTNAAVLQAVAAMESHVADPVPLGNLAAAAGVSERQLNRLFHGVLGRSTMLVYIELRLEKAMNLITNSPLSLTEIALATGFSSSSHFSRLFTRHFGKPPSAFR
ncbi:GlxA family transcriptional regulator [Roseovarius amoyensis]|uniref:GlxA family transcriptional regulator n=1 Tax=Roseovarius amoyensis TaxID=2211448 RepID=UPI001EF92682|nr:GlxA family transcriptional regulator [Roseovarius amoyensis]